MKKHSAVLDMRNDRLTFWPRHYQHDVALKPHAKKPHKELNIEAPHVEKPCAKPRAKLLHAGKEHMEKLHAEEPHANRPMKILKQTSDWLPELLLPYFLPSTRGVSKVANTSKAVEPEKKKKKKKKKKSTISQKPNTKDKTKVEDKKLSVERAGENNRPLDLAFIGGAPFIRLAKSKKLKHRAEIFAVSMRDVKYQLNKRTKPLTNPKTVVSAEYHDFLDVFSKEASNTVSPHTKFDHKIELLKDAGKLGHSALRGMSVPQFEFVKKFLEEHLKKDFIKASSALCSSPILLAKKPGGGIRFCVDYRKLNAITKKDAYPLPLIAETIAQLKKAVIFTKIDIRQAFHKLRMAVESKDATTFASRFGAYKWKVMPFGLTGGPTSWQRFINDLL